MSNDRSREFISFISPSHFLGRIFSGRGYIGRGVVLLAVAVSTSAAQAAGVAWHGNLQEAAQQAAAQHKPLLVMVKARWCGPCHKMLEQTFPNPAVAARINSQFVPVLLDADEHAAVVQSLGVEAMPTVLVIAPDRKVTGRLTGFQSAAQLDAQLAALAPPPVRQIAPPPFRRWSDPGIGQPFASRFAAAPPSGASFLRRHAIASVAVTPSFPPRPGLSDRQSFADRQGFAQRHGFAERPSFPERNSFAEQDGPVMPELRRPEMLADATEFGNMDTLSAAKAFSADGSTPVAAVAAGPTPNPPD
jgi:thiol-disulfide isomerase/thioredoxin